MATTDDTVSPVVSPAVSLSPVMSPAMVAVPADEGAMSVATVRRLRLLYDLEGAAQAAAAVLMGRPPPATPAPRPLRTRRRG